MVDRTRRGLLAAALGLGMTAGAVVAAELPDRTFLWRVDGGSAEVWLLGSVHALKPDSGPLPEAMERAFRKAEVAVFEVEMEQLGSAAVKLMIQGTLRGGKELRDVVPAELYRETVRHVQKAGLTPSTVHTMRPWMVALTLTSLELTRAGYDPEHGIDMHLYTRARAAAKRIVPLETVDDQVALFTGMTPEDGVAFLRYTLADLETVVPMLEEITTAWRQGRVEPLTELLTEGFEESPGLYEAIVVRRNASWQETIEGLLEGDEPAIVIVGALHLVGEEGLVERLRDAGYEVSQQ